LTKRGWKHVIGGEQGPLQRPHLTLNSELLGSGSFADPPYHSANYMQGYICGMVRGDSHIGSYSYTPRPGRMRDDIHAFRLALVDFEALERTRGFLAHFGSATTEFEFAAAAQGRRQIKAIRTSAGDNVAAIRQLIEWPRQPRADWVKGFLAGIFDAEGSYSRGVLRISNTDGDIIDRISRGLRQLGFSFVVEDRKLPNGLRCVRLDKGLRAHLRFFHTVDPSITRKRTISGQAIKNKTDLRVASIERLGIDMPMYDITTGTGDFIANGVVSHNCFARPTHAYLGLNAERDFEREIVVKVNIPELVRAELARPSWKHEHVALGTNTDPYQWVESRYELMPGIWEALRDSTTPCSLVTKSPLVLRDLPILEQIAERSEISVYLSVPTIEEKTWRASEPHTPSPRARLDAVRRLNEAGVPAGILVAPLMPGINDDPAQVDEIIDEARKAGAISASPVTLHLRGEVREIFFGWLRQHRPDLIERYEQIYANGAYATSEERERIASLVKYRRPAHSSRGRRRVESEWPQQEAAGRAQPRLF
jgi:DNA repair photolyase